jgi:hypothetical protein
VSRNRQKEVDDLIERADASLLDLIDNVLNKGVVLRAEVMLGVAGVDLVYLRLSAILCAADRIPSGRSWTAPLGDEPPLTGPKAGK